MNRPAESEYIETAREMYEHNPRFDNDIEIGSLEDKHVMTSQNDEGGCWVKAWVYVRDCEVAGYEDIQEYDGSHVENHCNECNEFESECICKEQKAA